MIDLKANQAKYDAECLLIALSECDDFQCAFCLGMNTFADDCGFFYLYPLGKDGYHGVCCKDCYLGEIGEMHIALHGLGER